MTEDEAKTKWCPQYQVSGEDDSNRSNPWNETIGGWDRDRIENRALCIASRCMAWRWHNLTYHNFKGALYLKVEGSAHDHGTIGYCGLAGRK